MMRILDRYILREVALTWLAVTGVLLVILVTSQLAAVLERAVDAHFSRSTVFALIGFSTVENLTILIPVGLLFGIVLALGRLYHESEMAAVHACGVGVGRLYAPVMLLGVAMAALLAWLALEMSPRSADQVQALRAEALRNAQFGDLEPGRFRSFGGSGSVFYGGGADPDGTLHDVFIKRSHDDRLEVTVAERARHAPSEDGSLHTFVLEDGRQYIGVPGNAAYRIIEFEQLTIPVRLTAEEGGDGKLDGRTTRDLLAADDLESRAELQWRLSMPLMALVLCLIAVPLSRLRPRQGRYARMGYAILVYFAYSNLLTVSKTWVMRGSLPPEVGLWWVHALFVFYAVYLLYGGAWQRRLFRRAAA